MISVNAISQNHAISFGSVGVMQAELATKYARLKTSTAQSNFIAKLAHKGNTDQAKVFETLPLLMQ